MQWIQNDLRYSLRFIRRSPGLAVVTVLTLALGIGANTAIFSILNALVLRTLPVWRPNRLVEVAPIYRNGAKVPLSSALFQFVRDNQRVFSDLFAWTGSFAYNMEADGSLFVARVRGVSGNYFSSLGATPLLGRFIGKDDAVEGAAPVAVIGYEFFERQFGGSPEVLGKVVRIEGEPFTIIGVSRKWFMGMTPGAPPDVSIPITATRFASTAKNRATLWLFTTGRLRDGVTIEQARQQLGSFWHQALIATAPTAVPGQRLQSWLNMGLQVNSAATGINPSLRSHFERPLQILMSVVVLILLVACANLANLMLARAAAREREMSVRLSLGATQHHIVRQLLSESMLLSATGALLAVALTAWAGPLLVAMVGRGSATPVILDVRPDWHVFGFAVLAALLTGVLIILAPLWHFSRQQPNEVLRGEGRVSGSASTPLARVLIVAQIALSFVLVVGAGLLLQTFESLRSFDPHYQRSGVVQLTLQPLQRGTDASKDADVAVYRKHLIDVVASQPGVISASFAGIEIPAGDSGWKDTVSSSAADSPADSAHVATLVTVSPEFFRTLGIPIISGRAFDWSDDDHHPRVAIVDSNLAQRLRAGGDVVGMNLRFGVQPQLQGLQCVGVARGARLVSLRDPNSLVIYVPVAQYGAGFSVLFVRSENPTAITRRIENEVRSLGHEYVTRTKTPEQMTMDALAEDRATAMLSSLFAGLAMLLAGIGLFGLMSYAVTKRVREIGIRMALGSSESAILQMILRESLLLTITGLLIGVPCALLATRLLAHVLFGIAPSDPWTFAAAATLLLMVGVTAASWPARRATKVQPIVALKYE
jgi:predicted permease